ncbi:MAG: DUF169 domain-containing protein [Candidatus Omnitrophota bacterium]
MVKINQNILDRLRNHWIKVKFYKKNPKLNGIKPLKNIKFCEATHKALFEPVLLNRKSISCLGAKHVFGWGNTLKNNILKKCNNKHKTKNFVFIDMFRQISALKKSVECIGLNTDDFPDMIISYLPPEDVMELIKKYNILTGKRLNFSLSSMMSICGGIAVNTYLENDINISFGCNDSRKYANIRRDSLAIGIPRRLFSIFKE